ncbi:putative Cytochrome P450 [Seiridium cardinale]|uniref:Cytochrome P450 n=1 Tax=Seiridium cardinale TaxID=138064 RepID=A0ABR2X9R3_9PEZI
MLNLSLLLGASVSVLLYLVFKSLSSGKSPSNFPPGPPAIAFLGNLHQIPLTKPFTQFAEWSRQYGSHGLVGLQLGPSGKAVVLNSWKSVRDLLDQRGVVYSSRPYVPLVEYVIPPPGDLHLVFMPYGAKWRKARKTITDFLKDDEVDKTLPIQYAESSQMIWELLQEPKRYNDHVLRYFGAVIMASVFGARGKEYSDGEKIKQFFTVQSEWAGLLDQGAVPPYDVFPFLRYIPDFVTPWRGWQKRAAALKARQSSLYHDLFEEAKERVDAGKGQSSFVASLLRNQERDGYNQVELEYITGFLMEGGSDTTAGAFETFILAMASHPKIQKKAQAEVDRVFGTKGVEIGRVKADELPYLRACFLETIRWRPGFPLSIPHATTQNDSYKGFSIPANTTILMNIWAVHHDPDEYNEPDAFNPDRFLANPLGIKSTGSSLDEALADHSRRPTYGFGAGRRVCAGQRMAENSMMMTMSKLLWSFDIIAEKKLDTAIHTAFKDAILTGPKEFPVDFRIRSESRREVIEDEWKRADEFLKQFE